MDIEIPARSPRPFSHRNGHYSLQLETVLVSLYYPSTFGSGTGRDACGQISRSRGIWLPGPRAEMAKGYGKFAGIPQWASMLFFLSTTWFTKIPAYRNAHVAAHWPPRSNSKCAEDKIKDEEAGLPDRQSERPVFPLMVFSHGLGGSRTAYSSLCGEFASYGFIVCAIEHRDGSGARTFVNHPPKYLNSYEKGGMKGEADRSAEQKHRNYDVVDFIYPKDNPYDTRPGNPNGVDEELRTQQLKLRQAEVEEAFEIKELLTMAEEQTSQSRIFVKLVLLEHLPAALTASIGLLGKEESTSIRAQFWAIRSVLPPQSRYYGIVIAFRG
jgi:platelet-activating factor acetylhydrolase